MKSKVVVSVLGDKNTKKIPGSDKKNIIIETLIKLLNSNLIKYTYKIKINIIAYSCLE